MESKVYEDYADKQKAILKCKELKTIYPTEDFNVVFSKNLYYVESGIPLIRNFEKLIYKTY
jgi:hypothetical protein